MIQVPLTSIGFVEGAQDMVDAGVISTERPQTREMRLRKCLAVLQQKKRDYLTGFSGRETIKVEAIDE